MSKDRADYSIADRECEIDERMCSHNETSSSEQWRMSPLTVAVILIIMTAMFTWGGYLWGGK
jgi:hypothetical protein